MDYFFTALGLMLIFEGIPYFICPEKMLSMLKQLEELSPQQLRIFGLVSMVIGLAVCYIVRRTNIF